MQYFNSGGRLLHPRSVCTEQASSHSYSIYVAPLHIEVLSEDPRIVMFHDFLTELEMITLKQMTLAEIEVK